MTLFCFGFHILWWEIFKLPFNEKTLHEKVSDKKRLLSSQFSYRTTIFFKRYSFLYAGPYSSLILSTPFHVVSVSFPMQTLHYLSQIFLPPSCTYLQHYPLIIHLYEYQHCLSFIAFTFYFFSLSHQVIGLIKSL